MAVYVTRERDMIDLVAWRHYGFQVGASEAILEANYGLSKQPPVLPAGLRIELPELARPRTTPAAVRLWDEGSAG